jgi:CheY-like chemotaxis protein
VFVDDEPAFLRFFTRELDLGLPVSRYESPRELLVDLSTGLLQTQVELDCWSSYSGRITDERHDHLLALDKTKVVKQVQAPHRFDTASVVVVDYAMPEMNGLELCRRLAHLPLRKILLTGQADDQVAVDAFNDGLIDYFLSKSAPNAPQVLRAQIRRFQKSFMADATELVRHALRTQSAVVDPAEGFLLVDADGRGRLLLTYSATAIEAQFTAARVMGAPEEVLDHLAQESVSTYFSADHAGQVLDAAAWRRACVPLQPFPTRSDRFYTLLDHCRPLNVSPQSVISLHDFLASED